MVLDKRPAEDPTRLRPLVFEPDLNGHRASYLRHLIEAIADLGMEPTVVTSQGAEEHPGYHVHLGSVSQLARWDHVHLPGSRSPLGAARAKAQALFAVVRRHCPDHLLVPYGDGLSQVISLGHLVGRGRTLSGLQSEALIFRVPWVYGAGGPMARMTGLLSQAMLCAAPWTRLHFQDPFAWRGVTERCAGLSERAKVMPEAIEEVPALSRVEARRRLGLKDGGRYVVLAGRINRRKGADLLLRAFATAELKPGDRLLLVGAWEAGLRREVRRLIHEARASDRLVTMDRYVSSGELTLALQAADVVAAPYVRHIGSASFVVRAAALGRPVLGSDFGWIGRTVQGFRLGRVCDVENPNAFISTIQKSLDEAHRYTLSESARRLVRYHSVLNFRAHWMARLRQRLGIPAPNPLTWDRVNEADPS